MTKTYFKISILYIIRTIILYIYIPTIVYIIKLILFVNVIRVNENRAE